MSEEPLMQMAMAVGDCSAEDADLLRRAMGSKRGIERIESIRQRLYEGMARNGLEGEPADAIYRQILAFADFGFAESHSLSFALLVYASSWFKLRHPAAFLAGLLDAQPMGFYSPATLVADARRHGVVVRRPDLARSHVRTRLEADGGEPAVRLGLAQIAGIGTETAARIVAERDARGPYRSMRDLVRRTGAGARQLEALAGAGAFESFGLSRRQALWEAGAAALDRAEFLPGSAVAVQPPLFADQTAFERLSADLAATGVSVDDHPIAHFRDALQARGVHSSAGLRLAEPGRRIEVAGLVTHRQRPATASGVTFINLEDEHGLVNVICTVGVWNRYRGIVRGSGALIVRGVLERSAEGVVNVLADRFEPLRVGVRHASRDFR